MNKCMVMIGAIQCALLVSADTWYVNAEHKGSSGDGRTEQTAFLTIQEAVDAAASDDTIRVLPGVYDRGETWDGYMNSRVVVTNKALTIESTGGKEVTHIVGERPNTGNIGEGAVRCIFAMGGAGTRFRGFTIRDGATRVNESTYKGVGAGLCAGTADANVYLIDCVISNCQARGGAALQGGAAIRTLIVGNRTFGSSNGTIARNGSIYNCLCVNNSLGGQPGVQQGNAVNCTFVGNGSGFLFSENCRVRNCLSVLNAGNLSGSGVALRDVRHTVVSEPADFGSSVRGTEGLIMDASERQMLAPALEDFRPMSGSVAATNGLADIVLDDCGGLSVPEEEVFFDYYGHPFPHAGIIACGAVQSLAPAPKSGAVTFTKGTFATFGVVDSEGRGTYAYPAEYPAFVHLTSDRFPTAAGGVFAYWIGSATQDRWRPPEMDESFHVMPPPGSDVAVGVQPATEVLYVNKDSVAVAQTGSADAPYKTIRQATESVSADAYSVIRVAAGVYDESVEGATTANGHPTRVVISKGKAVRLVGAGRGQTFIVGKADPVSKSTGANAARCVTVLNDMPAFVQGVTLTDGYSNTENDAAGKGAVAYMANAYCYLADCTLTNSVARNGIVLFGNCLRCVFFDCSSVGGCLRSMRSVVGCSFVGMPGTVIYADSSLKAVCNCSGFGPSTGGSVWGGGSFPTWNSAFQTGSSVTENPEIHKGCLVWNYATMPTDAGYVKQDPMFVSARDLRTFADSPVWTAGCKPTVENGGATYALWASSDLLGRPFVQTKGGAMAIGCYACPAVRVEVSAPFVGTMEPSGVIPLEVGESVTVTYNPDPEHATTRPYFGIAVNDEVVTTGMSCTLTAKEPDRIAPLIVSALCSTNWYVNANVDPSKGVIGDDLNDGFTAETPKRTLEGVMACDLLAGDCIHAAQGIYDEGQMYDNGGNDSAVGITSNRVVVADGMTLVGDEGADKTFIVGRSGVGTARCGAGALRCALLRGSAVLRGFTLLNGNTADGTGGSIDVDSNGGGVLCVGSATVYGCVISNCTATKGGGAMSGTLINCRLVDNGAKSGANWGDAARASTCRGCYFGPQRGSNGVHSLLGIIENCTFDGIAIQSLTSRPFYNCLFRNPTGSSAVTITTSGTPTFNNCLFDAENEATWKKTLPGSSTFTDCDRAPLARLQLDDRGCPVYGFCAAIDSGKDSLLPVSLAGLDAGGGQRIYNGRSDIGAFECDYRPVFARLLGPNVSVLAASPSVKEVGDAVRLTDESILEAQWLTPPGKRVRFTALATGGGVLTVEQNEDLVAKVSNEIRQVRLQATGCESLFFSYVGAGQADLKNFCIPGFAIFIR